MSFYRISADDASNLVIANDISAYSDTDPDSIRWYGMVDGEVVSEMWLNIDTHEIAQIETRQGHGRCGYASAIYRAACAEMTVFHAPASHRTPEGDAFANAVGGDALECAYGCCAAEPDFDDTDEYED